MADTYYYFIYRPIHVTGIGGVVPDSFNNKLELGLGVYDGMYLGRTTDPDNVKLISEFFIKFIPTSVANGFNLLPYDQFPMEDAENPGVITYRDFTTEEQQWKAQAQREIIKLKLRKYLEHSFGDIPDMLADLNKKVEIMERILAELGYYILNNLDIPEEVKTKYMPFVNLYNQKMTNNEIVIRADLEPDPLAMYEMLLNGTTSMNTKVAELYLQQISVSTVDPVE